MKTQVVVIGSGPAGLLLSEMLHWRGIESVVLEFMVYGQTSIQEDLYAAADRRGQSVLTEVEDVVLHGFDGSPGAKPWVTFTRLGQAHRLDCEFIAGCDGFHGVSRRSIPDGARKEYEKVYPFGWLGVMARVKPLPDITYVNHPRGFAMRACPSR